MRIVGGDGDREEGERGREGYMKRIGGGNGGAVIRMAFSWGEGGGGGEGNTLPLYLQYFFLCDIR